VRKGKGPTGLEKIRSKPEKQAATPNEGGKMNQVADLGNNISREKKKKKKEKEKKKKKKKKKKK